MKKAIFIFTSLLLMVSIAAIPSDSISAKTASSPQLSVPPLAQFDPVIAGQSVGRIRGHLELAEQCTAKHKKEFEGVRELIDQLSDRLDALEEEIEVVAKLQVRGGLADCTDMWNRRAHLRAALSDAANALAVSDLSQDVLKNVLNCVWEHLANAAAELEQLPRCTRAPQAPTPVTPAAEGGRPPVTPGPTETTRPPEEIEKLPGYSAKIVCGATLGEEGIKRGAYSTVINIHNASNKTVTLWIRASEAKTLDETWGSLWTRVPGSAPRHPTEATPTPAEKDVTRPKTSSYKEGKLKPCETIKVRCSDIRRLFEPSGEAEGAIPPAGQPVARTVSPGFDFVEGFAVIKSTAPLDVAGVYTSETPGGSNFQVIVYSPSSAGIFLTTPPETEEEEIPTEKEEGPPTTEVTPRPTEVTPSPPEEEAAKLGEIIIDPASDSNEVGTMHSITIKVFDTGGSPVPNAKVHVSQSGAHTGTIALVTGTDGKAGYYYIGQNAGTDTIVVTVDNLSASAIKEWYIPETEQPETEQPETGPAKWTPPTTEPADLTPTTESDLAE